MCNFYSQGSKTALQFLLLNGAKINTRDKAGKTALLLATELGIFKFLIAIQKLAFS